MSSLPIPDGWQPRTSTDDLIARQALEDLAAAAYDEHESVTEVIRPSAILSETEARLVLSELLLDDARSGGSWITVPTAWSLYDGPWRGQTDPGTAQLIGTMYVAYGTPGRYEITIFRASITALGTRTGWDVLRLCGEALRHAGLTLGECRRAQLVAPPRPFRLSTRSINR